MRLAIFLAAAAAAATITAAPANAQSSAATMKQHLSSLRITIGTARRLIARDTTVLLTGNIWVHHTLVPADTETARLRLVTLQRVLARANRTASTLKRRIAELVPPRPPHFDQWVCIHGHEASWTDTGSPYWGGLQMDIGFQQSYAAAYAREFHVADPYTTLGTADHWTPLVQMWVAEMAYKSRGFWPWPNTARYCRLL